MVVIQRKLLQVPFSVLFTLFPALIYLLSHRANHGKLYLLRKLYFCILEKTNRLEKIDFQRLHKGQL